MCQWVSGPRPSGNMGLFSVDFTDCPGLFISSSYIHSQIPNTGLLVTVN